MTTNTLLVLGARSDMARAIAHCFATAGWHVQLAARDIDTLAADGADLRLRYGIEVSIHAFDALAIEEHQRFVQSLPTLPNVVVCCVGYMGDQAQSEGDPFAAVQVIRSNFEGPASILAAFAGPFAARGSGTLVGVSSVAGERGRATNYVYGAAKAGFTTFLSGLRNRLSRNGVGVVTVLPGFVNTAMTRHMTLPRRLTAEPAEVGVAVFDAVHKKKDVVYVRRIWQPVMLVIRNIPERVFKRMTL